MPAEISSLLVSLAADATPLARGLDSAAVRVTAFERTATAAAARAENGVVGSFGRISTAAVASGARMAAFATGAVLTGIGGLVAALRGVTSSLDDLQTAADRLRMPVEQLQAWRYAAGETDVEITQLEGAFLSLGRKIGEAAKEASGPAAKAFADLGINVRDTSGNIKSTSDVVIELSAAIQRLPTQEQRLAAMFDLARQNGAELLRLLDAGPESIQGMLSKARELGLVMDADLVKRGADINREFEILEQPISVGVKGAVVEAAGALSEFFEQLKDFDDRSSSSLSDRLASLGAERIDVESKILALRAQDRDGIGGAWGADNSQIISTLEDQLRALSEEEGRILEVLEKRRSTKAATPQPTEPAPLPLTTFAAGVTPPTPTADPRKNLDFISGYDEVMAKAREATAQLEMERQALRLTTVEADALRRAFELLNQVQAQNGAVTPEQRAQIIALASDQAILADEIDKSKAKTEDLTKSATEGFKSIADSIGQAIVGTKDWKTVLGDVISLLIKLASNWLGPKIATALGVAPAAATTDSVASAVSRTLAGTPANDNVSTAAVAKAVDLAAQREAIGAIESGGDYGALGVLTKSGDRAYGKYQVMGSNVGPWTKDALGYSMTPDQFLSAPWAQDMVFNKQFGNSLAKYGNANDAASVWFTGRPMSTGAGATDILGTSGSQYVANFNAALEKTTGSLGNMNSTVTDAIGLLGKPANNATWLSGGATNTVAKAASGPLDLGQFTGGGASSGGFLTNITGLFTNIFSGLGKMLSGLVGGAAKGIGGFFSSILGALFNAKGNAFGPSGLTAFAGGGVFTNSIVSTPTMFKFGNGDKFGVMGEAGQEAVMPLSKDSSGWLGVSLHGAMNDNWAIAMGGMAKVAAGARMSGGGHVVHYRAGDTVIQGNITEDIWPRVRAEIAMSAADTKKDISRNFGSYQRMSMERD